MSSKEKITLENVVSGTEYWGWIKEHLEIEHGRLGPFIKTVINGSDLHESRVQCANTLRIIRLGHLIKKGINYTGKGEWPKAAKAYKKSLSCTENAEILKFVHYSLALCQHNQGHYADAIEELLSGLTLMISTGKTLWAGSYLAMIASYAVALPNELGTYADRVSLVLKQLRWKQSDTLAEIIAGIHAPKMTKPFNNQVMRKCLLCAFAYSMSSISFVPRLSHEYLLLGIAPLLAFAHRREESLARLSVKEAALFLRNLAGVMSSYDVLQQAVGKVLYSAACAYLLTDQPEEAKKTFASAREAYALAGEKKGEIDCRLALSMLQIQPHTLSVALQDVQKIHLTSLKAEHYRIEQLAAFESHIYQVLGSYEKARLSLESLSGRMEQRKQREARKLDIAWKIISGKGRVHIPDEQLPAKEFLEQYHRDAVAFSPFMVPFVIYQSVDFRSTNATTDNKVAYDADQMAEFPIGSGKIAFARDQAMEWLGAAQWARRLGMYSKASELLYIAHTVFEEYGLLAKLESAFSIKQLLFRTQDLEKLSMTARSIASGLNGSYIDSFLRVVETRNFYYTDLFSQPLRLANLSARIIQGLLFIELGYILVYQATLEDASECLHKALLIAKEVQSQTLQYEAEYLLADIDLCKDAPSDAILRYHAVAEGAETIGDLQLQGRALAQEAACQSLGGQTEEAVDTAERAVTLLGDLHAIGAQADAEVTLGSVYLRFGEPARALAVLSHGRDILARLGWVRGEARALAFEALALDKLGRARAAKATYSRYATLLPRAGAYLIDKDTEDKLRKQFH